MLTKQTARAWVGVLASVTIFVQITIGMFTGVDIQEEWIYFEAAILSAAIGIDIAGSKLKRGLHTLNTVLNNLDLDQDRD